MAELRSIALSEELCRAVEEKFVQRFSTLEELVNSLLRDLVRDEALELDKNEQAIIEERLKGLGYV